MPAPAKVISLSSRRPYSTANLLFSTYDAAAVGSLIGTLTDEVAGKRKDASAQARIYFYFSFHRYCVRRWIEVLFSQDAAEIRQLGERLEESFDYVTSAARLEEGGINDSSFRMKLRDFVIHLSSLMFLIQASLDS